MNIKMKTILRSLLVFNILAFWTGSFIDVFESELFAKSHNSILETFNNFIYDDNIIFVIAIFFILYAPYVLLFFLTKFSRQIFTLSMAVLSLMVFLPYHDYPLIRFPYSNLFFEISLILDGIILATIWFSPLKDSFSNSDFDPMKVINFFRNKRFYIASGILVFVFYVWILSDEINFNNNIHWLGYIGGCVLMAIILPWVLLLLASLLISLSYILLFPIRSFKVAYGELYNTFYDYLPDIHDQNGKKSFNISLLFSFPIWIIFAYFYYFILIELITIDLFHFFFDKSFFEILQNTKIHLPLAWLLFALAIFSIFIIPGFICGIILIMIFGIVHTFRKINQPSIKDKDENLEKARETFAKEFFDDDEGDKKGK